VLSWHSRGRSCRWSRWLSCNNKHGINASYFCLKGFGCSLYALINFCYGCEYKTVYGIY
jgi:hypothetical protein